jgi:hypothetical protein
VAWHPYFLAQVSFHEQRFYDAEHFLSCGGGSPRAPGLDRLERIGGYRSAIAASILANHGMTAIADLVGGLAAWEAMGLDLAVPAMT